MDQIRRSSICGVLNLDKPKGVTSRDVVDRVARPLKGVRVGHAGTLDPLATGVLVVCVGAATRLIEYVQGMPKVYRTVIRLGARSDTLDADGRIVEVPDPVTPDEAAIRGALASQVGTILQLPPQYSALKVGGRRAYDLARAGQAVELAPRPVVVSRIDLLAYEWPRLELEIECGGGTYIRSIARDLGEAMSCGGLVEVLVRERIGPYTRAEAVSPDALSADSIPGLLRPASEAAAGLPQLPISSEQVAAVARGQILHASRLAERQEWTGEVALVGPDGALAAIAEADPATGRIAPRRVLVRG